MKILFVSSDFPIFDGLDCGASNRSTLFIEALSKNAFVDVISFYEKPVVSNVKNCKVIGCYPLKRIKKLSRKDKILNYVDTIFRPFSPYTYYKCNKYMESIVDDAIKQGDYDYVSCRYIRCAVMSGLNKYSDKLIIDVDDNLVSASLRDISAIRCRLFITKIKLFYQAYTIGFMSKLFLSKVYRSYYSNINEPTYKKSIYLPNVTAIENKIPEITNETPMHILFVGWLDFHPNKTGIQCFVKNVFPLIKKAVPNVTLRIAGKTKDSGFLSELNSIDGINALGFVDDISKEYKNCRVVIVPVYSGAGTSVKFIEASVMNRPIVTTPDGVRGFEKLFIKGKHYMEASNDNDFAQEIITLLNSETKSIRMAKEAYKVGKSNFSKEYFCNIIKKSIQ